MAEPKMTDVKESLTETVTSFKVDESVTTWLKDQTEIIFDVATKALQDNRYEVFQSVMVNINAIVIEYLQLRRMYSSEDDTYLEYVGNKFTDIIAQIQLNTPPTIMVDIEDVLRNVSLESLDIKPIRAFAGENFIPYRFIEILGNICLSSEILKGTTASPSTSISHLVDIANKAIANDFPKTAGVVLQKLSNISLITTTLHSQYSDFVATKANWGMAAILNTLLLSDSPFVTKYDIDQAQEFITKSIREFIGDDKIGHTYRTNIKPFFGVFSHESYGIAGVYSRTLEKTDNTAVISRGISSLKKFMRELDGIVLQGIDKTEFLDIHDIMNTIYPIGYALFGLKELTDAPLKEDAKNILRNDFLTIYKNVILTGFSYNGTKNSFSYDYVHAYFSLVGIMLSSGGEAFYKVVDDWTSIIISMVNKYKVQTSSEHDGHTFKNHNVIYSTSELVRYLRLTGAWYLAFYNDSPELLEIKKLIKSIPNDLKNREDEYNIMNRYPSFMMERWIVMRPFMPFNAALFSTSDNKLFNQKIIQEFEGWLEDANTASDSEQKHEANHKKSSSK
jgi:hypothetical protein